MLPRLSILAVASLLAACAAPPLPPGPQGLAPAAFMGLPAAEAPAGPAPMSRAFVNSDELERIEAEVVANNRDLRVAAARMRQAQALADAAGTSRLPTADAAATAKRVRAPDDKGGHSSSNSFELGTSAKWELDLWGRWSANTQAARLDAQASALDRDAAEISLRNAASTLQAELITLGNRLQLASETLAVQTQLLELVRARVGAGRGTALDLARAEALVATTSGSVPALRSAACITRLRLDVLRGRPPADCARAESDRAPALLVPRRISLGELPDPKGLFAKRPDLQAAFVRAEAAGARVNQAWAARWPSLSLDGQIGWSAAKAGDLLKSASLGGSLGAGLSWQWLDFGKRKAEENAARAGFEAAAAEAEQAQLQVLQETQGSLFTLKDAEAQVLAQSAAAEATARARELALKRYEAGVSDFFSLLDAERERLTAQDRLLQLGGARDGALLAVHKAFAARLAADR